PDAMISALRKIEGRGELQGATSAVMEMCIDNPRQDFSNIFDTHPPIDARVGALVKYAGGHEPGPLAFPPPGAITPEQDEASANAPAQAGPWSNIESTSEKLFLPSRPPVEMGPTDAGVPGPWGPHRK